MDQLTRLGHAVLHADINDLMQGEYKLKSGIIVRGLREPLLSSQLRAGMGSSGIRWKADGPQFFLNNGYAIIKATNNRWPHREHDDVVTHA